MVLATFADFMQQVVSGLASGGVYALLALALVIIHRSTGRMTTRCVRTPPPNESARVATNAGQ